MNWRNVSSAIVTLSVSVVSTLAILLLANFLAGKFLNSNPELLLSPEDRINENTRTVREAMISPKDAVSWFDLESGNEAKAMWDEFYRAVPRFESYVHFRSSPVPQDRYYGVTPEGFRKVRDVGPWPVSNQNFNVFFFGGSTSFGVGPYWATVASYLQQSMNASRVAGKPVRVYNFGRSGYQSSQESILFQRLLSAGHRPDMVVFLDGLNDFCYSDGQPSSWQSLAAYFDGASDQYRRQAAGHGVVTKWELLLEFVRAMPLMRLTNVLLERAFSPPVPQYVNTASKPQLAPETPESEATLQAVIRRYVNNMRQVKAVSEAFGIVPVFVWQPIPTYKYDLRHHVFNPDRLGCHVNSKAGYPMMLALGAAKPLGSSFIWAADIQEALAEPLYVDAFHYTAPMSMRIAELVVAEVRSRGLLKGARP